MLTAIASVLLAAAQPAAAAAPANAVQVDVGRFDPAAFPQAEMRERRMPHNTMLTRIEDILRERRCRLAGQSHRRFDIRVPYVVRLEPDGTPTRFVVADIGCRPLESFIGQIILELARVGDFRPTAANEPQWYSSELRFMMGTPVF
ncbi:MAG TPA: hypothetical protein VGB08_07975 [Allosphingosinicella sp.]|jgi:hypothetical protein